MVNTSGSQRIGILATKEIELIRRADNRKNLIRERSILLEKEPRTKKEDERIREINQEIRVISTRLSDLVQKLHKRIASTEKDLVMILKSQSLRPLVVISNKHLVHFPFPDKGDYGNYGAIQSISDIYQLNFIQYDGTESIPNYSRWKVRFKAVPRYDTRYYWLDASIEPVPTIEDIFSPEYSMKGIKGIWSRRTKISTNDKKEKIKTEKIDSRLIIREALDLEKRYQGLIKLETLPKIFPRNESGAIDIMEIRNKISVFHEMLQISNSIVPRPVNSGARDDQATRELERRIAKGSEDMKRAYSEIKPDIEKIQKKLKKYGLKLAYGTSDLND